FLGRGTRGRSGCVFAAARGDSACQKCSYIRRNSCPRTDPAPGIPRRDPTDPRSMSRRTRTDRANAERKPFAKRRRTRVLTGGCHTRSRISGAQLMFSRAYKSAVTVPPLAWVTVFLLLPYLLMFCYSFWSVSPSQTIVHSWSLENYRELLQKPLYW